MISQSRTQTKFGSIAVIVMVVMLVPLLAAINAWVGPYAVLPYLGIAALIALLALPLNLLVFGCFVFAAVIAGVADYFGHVSQGFWLPYLMGALFALRGIGERLRPVALGRRGAEQAPHAMHLAFFLGALYLAVLVFSTVVALPPLPQVIVAAKNYLFFWGLLLALLWCPWSVESSNRLWTIVVVVACLQWPVALYQRFFVAAKRGDAAAWDAVVGTLGGNPETGGHSAAMALLCCIAVAVLLFRMRERRLGVFTGWMLVLLCLLPIALAEVKAGFIWLAVVFVFFFARHVVREPVRALLTLVLGATLLVGMAWIYKATFYERSGSSSISEIYDKQIKYALDPNEFSSQYQRLGRVASVMNWWQKHDLASEPLLTLIGHGPGASRSSSSFGLGELARKLAIPVDVTGASTLLWDIGLLGAAAFLALLLSSTSVGYRLSRQAALAAPWRESAFISGVTLLMIAVGIFYNRDAIDHPAVQMVLFASIAQVFLAQREFRRLSAAAGATVQERTAPLIPVQPLAAR